MSGHSKWSKVKHQKATTDAAKSQAFTKASRAITIAVREGGGIGDPEKNYHLRLALEKAREANMPKDTIERAISRGLAGEGSMIESVIYEGYGPGGIALVIEAATDNRARTVAEVKHVLEQAGGSLASEGAVNFLFTRMGEITVPVTAGSVDRIMEIAIDSGADDVKTGKNVYKLYTTMAMLAKVKAKLIAAGIPVASSNLVFKPVVAVAVKEGVTEKIHSLASLLESLEDVQHVYTNLAETL